MNIEYSYWCFKDAITQRICDDIIKYACDKKQSFSISDVELNNDVYMRDQVTTANFFKYNFCF